MLIQTGVRDKGAVPAYGALLGAALTLCGCELFESHSCKQGVTRCSGNRVQSCVLDPTSTTGSGQPGSRWNTDKTCKDDAQLGRFTCGLVQGKATCVPAPPADAGVSPMDEAASSAQPWLRVGIARDGETVRISSVEPFSLTTPLPSDPAWGGFAAVAYQGNTVVDATLVPFDANTVEAFAWVRGAAVDRIALLKPDESVLASVQRVVPTSATPKSGLGRIDDALADTLSPTLRVFGSLNGSRFPATPAMLQIVNAAFAAVPASLTILANEVICTTDNESARLLQVTPPSTLPDADAGAEVLITDKNPLTGTARGAISEGRAGRLWLDFSSSALKEYALGTNNLSFAIIEALGQSFGQAAQELPAVPVLQHLGLHYASDYLADLAKFLTDQLAPLLQTGETPFSAWGQLHGVAVDANLAKPYTAMALLSGVAAAPANDAAAVQQGFASADGAGSADADLLSYLARANVPTLWSPSPCDAIRAQPLDQIAPALLVHVAKLLALRGLELLDADKLQACVGTLHLSSGADAIAIHKPDGERIVFTDMLEGIRQPYFGTEVQLSWKAQRSYMALSLSVGYRGNMPAIMRLSAIASQSSSNGSMKNGYGAVFAITNPDGYQTSVAKGGLVVVTNVTPDALEAYALMVALDQPQAGTKVFPLVSAQSSTPVWGAAP